MLAAAVAGGGSGGRIFLPACGMYGTWSCLLDGCSIALQCLGISRLGMGWQAVCVWMRFVKPRFRIDRGGWSLSIETYYVSIQPSKSIDPMENAGHRSYCLPRRLSPAEASRCVWERPRRPSASCSFALLQRLRSAANRMALLPSPARPLLPPACIQFDWTVCLFPLMPFSCLPWADPAAGGWPRVWEAPNSSSATAHPFRATHISSSEALLFFAPQ